MISEFSIAFSDLGCKQRFILIYDTFYWRLRSLEKFYNRF
ncbi:hypothetical protein Halxa_3470 [Halopiger xanaduensis SH-6]|uniref:Uncharacterized protein n=1 Tax=Halopiger xanaduensis (strain DSM 18323 / JCM 14033 / SH-6) TaxID=797210 RepID=F8D9J5_HALXS|nr:hypothetical protein Halxa_3470 [Halopiger xanaduensis SH-6]